MIKAEIMEIVESGLTICMENSYHEGVSTTIRRKAIGRRGRRKNAEKENVQQFAVGIGSSRFWEAREYRSIYFYNYYFCN